MKMKAVIFGDSHTRRLKAWKVFPKGGRKARTATADYDWSMFVKTCREAEKVVVLIGSNDIQQRLEELYSPQYAACAILADLHRLRELIQHQRVLIVDLWRRKSESEAFRQTRSHINRALGPDVIRVAKKLKEKHLCINGVHLSSTGRCILQCAIDRSLSRTVDGI